MVTGSSITRCGRNHILFRCSPHLKRREAPADVIEPPSWSCELCADVGGSGQINFIRFFEPFKHLRWGDRSFRQMRIERARADIWRVDQSRSRKFLGLSLVRKCFGYPCARSRFFGLKRNVPPPFAGHDGPRALGLAGHDETLSRLRRSLAVGDKPKLLGILGNARRDLRDLNPFPAIQSLPPAGVPK
jgi:hypothetical protein